MFKNFRVNCVLRVMGITLTIIASVCLFILTGFYITASIAFLFAILQTFQLIEYVEKTNRKISRLISSIENEDFAVFFTDNRKGYPFRELTQNLNRVVQHFSNSKREKEEALLYLETVMQHSPVALIAVDTSDKIQYLNKAARGLTSNKRPTNITEFTVPDLDLAKLLKQHPNSFDLSYQNYTLRISKFVLHGDQLKLISIQNIHRELNAKESDSWHRLLRVLTHEIMNSVTPIASIAATGEKIAAEYTIENRHDITKAFETIKRRSEALVHFTNSYRSFSSLPNAENEKINLCELTNAVKNLLTPRFKTAGIALVDTTNTFFEIYADKKLSEQVLINILLNASEALSGTPSPQIKISSVKKLNRIQLIIKDNGPGIPSDIIDKIFIPFFTTKPKGSGIGLSLSRELMKLQNGHLVIQSSPGNGALVKLIFEEAV